MNKKISIIGAGNVGGQTAFYAAIKQFGNVVLLDIEEGIAKGKALDILHATPVLGSDVDIKGTGSYEDTKDSDVVVITAGSPRKPGMSRDDLLNINTKVVKEVIEQAVKYSPNAIIIVVTNPLDAMVYVASEASKLPKNRIIGMAGCLDSARFKTFIAKELDVSVKDVKAMVLGSHSDTMVPLIRHATVKGKPVSELLEKDKIKKIVERVRNGGAEIVSLLKTGSAFFAPGIGIIEMIDSIINDKKEILPCTAYCNNQYGINGLFVGVPARLGINGVEEIIELDLSKEEKEQLKKSAEHIKSLVETTKRFL